MNSLKENNSKKRALNSENEEDILRMFDYEPRSNRESETVSKSPYNKSNNKNKSNSNSKTKIAIIAVVFSAILICLVSFAASQPSIKIVGDKEQHIEVMTEFVDLGAKASYFGFDSSENITVNGSVDTKKVGTYTLEYSIKKGDKTKTVSRTVIVEDTTPPDIQLKGGTEVNVSKFDFYSELGYSAIDNYEGDLSANVKVSQEEVDGVHIFTYTVADSVGNQSKATRKVIIKDVVAPTIYLNGKDTVWVAVGKNYTDLGASAIDDLDGNVSDKITVSGEVDTKTAGEYAVTYKVSDSSGNTATATRTVKVAPESSIPENERAISSSVIYLTFDDGPGSQVTPRILDTLKKYNIKATFFICNYSEANKAIVQRAVNEGHSIGIHGYTHSWDVYTSDETYLNNIASLHDKLLADTGYDSKITRFLGGSSNTISAKYSDGIMTRLSVKVPQAGYQYFDWNVSSGDADANTVAASKIISNVKNYLVKDRNNIVLMHDTNAKTTTADALPEIIEFGLSNGYTFLPITEDTPPVHHHINN